MLNEILTLLEEYGLDNNEREVFLFLVGKNQLTAYQIANGTKIHKSTCYDILERLIQKGFVSKSKKGNKKIYTINEISKVIGRIKTKEAILQKLIPEIQKIEIKEESYVKYSDSRGSYQEIDNKIYHLAKEGKLTFVYILSNGSNLTTTGTIILVEKLIKELSKSKKMKKIDAKGIWDKKFMEDKFMKQFNIIGENRFLEYLPTKATTIIFDNHLAFLFFNSNDNVIEIKNKFISEEMKTYFEYLWGVAKQ